jgi:hypothetical protein
MISMKLSKAEAKTMLGCCPEDSDSSGPKYPYGLTMYLNESILKKLGMGELPEVGAKMNLAAICVVTGTSSRQDQDGSTHQCIDIQITDMELAEDGKSEEADPAGAMYPSMKK